MTIKSLLINLIFLISCHGINAQETLETYDLRSSVKELTIKTYMASEKNDTLAKGRFWHSKAIKGGSRIVEFDSLGNVNSVHCFDRRGKKSKLWYFFERDGNNLTKVILDERGNTIKEELMTFKNQRLFEFRIIKEDKNHIECFDRYQYNTEGEVIKILKYDDNSKLVGSREMISDNQSKSTIKETIIDSSPYLYKVFDSGNSPKYERKQRNTKNSITRKYNKGALISEYDNSKRTLKEYNSSGNLTTWTTFDVDDKTIKFISNYSYTDKGLLSKIITDNGNVKSTKCAYSYQYNDLGDWIKCEENCRSLKYIYERDIVYW